MKFSKNPKRYRNDGRMGKFGFHKRGLIRPIAALPSRIIIQLGQASTQTPFSLAKITLSLAFSHILLITAGMFTMININKYP